MTISRLLSIINTIHSSALVSQVIRFKTYRGYVKPQIIPNAVYNVIFV
jgi:hypothetical protein